MRAGRLPRVRRRGGAAPAPGALCGDRRHVADGPLHRGRLPNGGPDEGPPRRRGVGRHGHVNAAAEVVHDGGGLLKVIVEAGLLSPAQIERAASLAADGGADFVKTSTGVYGGGATVDQVRLLRSSVPPMVGVKASGGIATLAGALAMLEAGADRLGTSSAASILAELSR
ncbi:MAG: hypothetical protein E6G66_16665 [Actinobacteria bacterium]|nr:MAG: hypothetical protein E6G66_16665 [Actinomycetota bacterium]